jgi:hypothetical protein
MCYVNWNEWFIYTKILWRVTKEVKGYHWRVSQLVKFPIIKSVNMLMQESNGSRPLLSVTAELYIKVSFFLY